MLRISPALFGPSSSPGCSVVGNGEVYEKGGCIFICHLLVYPTSLCVFLIVPVYVYYSWLTNQFFG